MKKRSPRNKAAAGPKAPAFLVAYFIWSPKTRTYIALGNAAIAEFGAFELGQWLGQGEGRDNWRYEKGEHVLRVKIPIENAYVAIGGLDFQTFADVERLR